MCDCASLSHLPYEFDNRARRLGLFGCNSKPRTGRIELLTKSSCGILPNSTNLRGLDPPTARIHGNCLVRRSSSDDFKRRSSRNRFSGSISGVILESSADLCYSLDPSAAKNCGARCTRSNSAGVSENSDEFDPEKYEPVNEVVNSRSGSKDVSDSVNTSGIKPKNAGTGASVPSSFDFLELKRELEKEESGIGSSDEEDLIQTERIASNSEEVGEIVGRSGLKNRRQILRRSNLLAKQVISIRSACSLGFISQLWVDTRSWVVALVEVRPNLLSGEMEKFLLEDVCQVGDVVLVPDEGVMENELKMIGLDTLVGYSVVTSGRRNVGKVRGYTFNINSGAVEALELDSFGISLIPASLVSTYCLFVEDVLEVASDTVVVHEGAVSRVQRLTKGFWDTRNLDTSEDEMGEYYDYRRRSVRSVHRRSSRKDFSRRKFSSRVREPEDDWELPMDY